MNLLQHSEKSLHINEFDDILLSLCTDRVERLRQIDEGSIYGHILCLNFS